MRRWIVCAFMLFSVASGVYSQPTPEDRARKVLHAVLEMSQRSAIQFGNYREALAILRFHRKVMAGQGNYERTLNRFEGLTLLAAGRYFEADQLCQSWQSSDPAMQTILRCMALALSSRPDPLKVELDKLADLQLTPLQRFTRGSLQFHLDWLRGQPGDVAQRFRTNLAELKPYHSDRDNTTAEPWLLEHALKLWEGPMLTLMHTENQDIKARQTLIDAYFEGQRRLQDLAQQNLGLKTLNPEYNFMVVDNLLTTYEDFLAYLWFERSAQQEKELNELLGDLDSVLTRSSQTYLADQKTLAGMLEPIVSGVPFEGQVYPLSLAQFETRSGTLARLLSRFKTIQLHSLWEITEGKLDRATASRAEQLLREASAEQQRLGFHGAYLGLNDARFDRVELLIRQQEEGWQSQAQLVLNTLSEEARQQHYPPAQVAALALQARTALALGQLEQAEQWVDEAVALHEQGVLGFDLSAAALVEKRRRNSRLYRLQSEIKMRRGDPEGALQGLERERQSRRALERGLPPDLSSQLARREALESELRQPGESGGIDNFLAQLKQADWASATTRAARPKLTSLAHLRQLLPPSTSVIVYLPLEKELRMVVVRPSGVTSRTAPVAEAALNREVRLFRSLVATPEDLRSPQSQKLLQHSRQLYAWLIGPVAADISQDETLAVVAVGSLNYLPFAALVGPDSSGPVPDFLGRSKVCVNLAGVGDILQLSQPRPPLGQQLLALGNPDGTLPAAEREVEAIATLFPHPEVYLGTRATRHSLTSPQQPPNLVHIATHGNLDSGHPKASYLTLAGAGPSAKLRVSDIYSLPLTGIDLVVLSACQTALGEWDPGSEITSLADAFQVAGSRSVIASLWSVDDNSTSTLMQALYRNRPGHSLGKALQLAQRQLQQQPATAHPFFWAPFLVLGDFR